MANRLAVVFGGSGFIGRHLVQRLAAEGWRVRVAVRDPEGAAFLKPLGDVGQVVPVFADVTKDASVTAAVQGAELVVNLVGILYERGKRSFKAIHEDAAGRIAAAAKAAGAARLIHVSALGADAGSASAYSRTKAAGEAAVLAAFPQATILRPSVVFGPEDDFFNGFVSLSTYSPVLPVFVADGFKPKFCGKIPCGIDLYGSGGTKLQPVYVGDVAKAAMAVLASPETCGKAYALGGPNVYSFKQVLELALKSAGRCRLLAPLPFFVAKIQAAFLQFLPKPLLTPDQVKLLATDNVVPLGVAGLADLGITPTAAEVILPTYLSRFKNPYIHRKPA
ncbi:MAG TPA: complex I NDUFA9 subunit family protein [Candidatus Sulfotelmatobacter sp.]|jgi:NADH dehydrogenase|nr:complex I NDUFA9 subunit family protein [Candidatus Sulfotelmatobacter sp.]